jgi:hypothetical protein
MGDQLESAEVTKISTNQVYLKISQEIVTLTSPDAQFLRLGVSRSTSPVEVLRVELKRIVSEDGRVIRVAAKIP